MRFGHYGVDHEVRGVRLDDIGGGGSADYVGEIAAEAGGGHGGEVGGAGVARVKSVMLAPILILKGWEEGKGKGEVVYFSLPPMTATRPNCPVISRPLAQIALCSMHAFGGYSIGQVSTHPCGISPAWAARSCAAS